jgi:DNA primase
MISKTTIQKINDEARVEDVVGEFVTLKKRGSNLLGLCPFHNEKTPSFNVNPARNIYKCFGCGKAGGPIQFLIDYQQLSYPDALRFLAKKYNIEIEEEKVSDEDKQKELEQHNLVESIHIANTAAQKFFTDYMLHNESGKIGLAYFKERGFLGHTIERFQLGFAPDGFDVFTKHALKEGFQLEVLKKAGLTSPKENSTVDFFRNRVMFPIHNVNGKIVAFAGRTMLTDKKIPKYVNTAESEVYQKSEILYGAFFAKKEISKKDDCLLVEGYTDVISLHQAGIENAVASSGTSLTTGQVRFLKRLTKNITILYDGDAAGIKAALRGMNIVLEEDMNVHIVNLPAPEDPDSYVKKVGVDQFLDYINRNKKDFILFITSLLAEEGKANPLQNATLYRDIVESVSYVPDPLKRSTYLRRCAEMFGLDEQMLITETNKVRRKREDPKRLQRDIDEIDKQLIEGKIANAEKAERLKGKKLQEANAISNVPETDLSYKSIQVVEKDIIRILIEFGNWKLDTEEEIANVTAYVLDDLEGIEIETPKYKLLYDLVKREFAQGHVHDEKFFTTNEDEKISALAIEILTLPYSLSDNWWAKYKIVLPDKKSIFIKDIQSACVRLKQFRNIAELRKLEKLLKEIKDEAELTRLMKLHKLLIEQKKEFALTVGNVIYRPAT